MAKPRQKTPGSWELCVRHALLPGGRKYLSFPTEAAAADFARRWDLRKAAGLPPPADMLVQAPAPDRRNLGMLLRAFESSGVAAPSQIKTLRLLDGEVGLTPLADVTLAWLMQYIQRCKTREPRNLAPSSIRHRVQAIGRSWEHHLLHHPAALPAWPGRSLPRGYSSYSEVDAQLVKAAGGSPRMDVVRDRRLNPGEEDRIVRSLTGHIPEGRERALGLHDGDALATLYTVIVNTGLRLLEAVRLRAEWIHDDRRVVRVQSSKQRHGRVSWRDVPTVPLVLAVLRDRATASTDGYLWPFIAEAGGDATRASRRVSARMLIAIRHAGINDLHEHDLRHEATCRWLEMRRRDGAWLLRMEEINRIMGWAPGSLMAQRYASFRADDMAARIWDEALRAGGSDSGAAGPSAAA